MMKSKHRKRSAPPASVVTPDEPLVIEILDSDDEIQRHNDLDDIRKRIKSATPSATKSASTIVIDCDDDDDDDGGGKIGAVCPLRRSNGSKRLKTKGPDLITSSTTHSNSTSEISEIQVVSGTEATLKTVAASERAGTGANEDIEVIGTKGTERLPHMRQHCPDNEFVEDVLYYVNKGTSPHLVKKGLSSNKIHCDMCFCYVCDVPVKDCKHWVSDGDVANINENHCLACDKGDDGNKWKRERDRRKNGTNEARHMHYSEPETHSDDEEDEDEDSFANFFGRFDRSDDFDRSGDFDPFGYPSVVPYIFGPGKGPFDPTKATKREIQVSSKCRNCGWYSRLKNNEGPSRNCPGENDWCHACGRVCRKIDFGKWKSAPYTKQFTPGQRANDIHLGTKTISFTVHPHDPRKLKSFKEKWAKYEGKDGWRYNERDMCQDFFNHRLGEWPTIGMILNSIPIVSEAAIPDALSYEKTSNTEAEYILLQSKSDKFLLEEVNKIDFFGRANAYSVIRGDVRAELDETKKRGTFTVRLFSTNDLFRDRDTSVNLSQLFGAWFGVTPFDLSSLVRGSKASDKMPVMTHTVGIGVPPFRLDRYSQELLLQEYETGAKPSVKAFNAASENFHSQLSFTSSFGKQGCGGIADNGTDFSSLLTRYFSEEVADDIREARYCGDSKAKLWCSTAKGVQSFHRNMRIVGNISGSCYSTLGLRYIREQDRVLAMAHMNLPTPMSGAASNDLNGLMQMLENLGHTPCQHTDGLNVELLEYQKQTVQWALERETKEGGVESFFWSKLPQLKGTKQSLYFNPILNMLSSSKPRHVRGGIIAEEMGLGKTVISLALILHNPAPANPISGSLSTRVFSGVKKDWNGKGWNPSHSGSLKNGRGKTLSRGTLVICHVSLVGQWIDEAKSKLTEPGLVYPYHGSQRNRDAGILAGHSIVVTTYATLASDKFFHAKKEGARYVPPCEKVRWWRIICDESHSLRDGATQKTRAVMDLVGDHRWCVSGTPMNTGIKDLKMQLKFVGLDRVDELLSKFITDGRFDLSGRRRDQMVTNRKLASFLFYMRQIMMRHTKKQRHIGTTTALMALPGKEERIINVNFTREEAKEYKRIERDALTFYESFKQTEGHQLSKHFLLLYQKLTPLRIACSGGGIPAETDKENRKKDSDIGDESPGGELGGFDSQAKKKIVISDVVFKSKLSILVKELERIRDEEPNAKSLIFSQFTSTLKFLQNELPKHGFDFRTLSGDMSMKKRAKALHDFQTDPPTTIFLLSMRAGAVGINLTQANRVFILEPAFNPALEAQAVGRVHRMGQKQKVEIIRIVMQNSVETRLRSVLDKKYGTCSASVKTDASSESLSDKKDSRTAEGSDDELDGSTATGVASLDDPEAVVGSICTDRTTVLTAEFDELFGSVATPDTHMSTTNGGNDDGA